MHKTFFTEHLWWVILNVASGNCIMKNTYTFKDDECEDDMAFQKDKKHHADFKGDDVSWYL